MIELGFPRFVTIIKQMLKLIINSSILIKVSNWDLKRALNRPKQQKVHFNSSPSDVQLTLDTLYYKNGEQTNYPHNFLRLVIRRTKCSDG